MIRILERIMGSPLKRETFEEFDYTAPAPPKTDSGFRGRGAPREIPAARRAPLPRRRVMEEINSRRGRVDKVSE